MKFVVPNHYLFHFWANELLTHPDTIKTKHILLQHQDRVMSGDPEDAQSIIVRRSHIFADASRTFTPPTFNPTSRVTFVGEAAVDEGGPRREFFRLLMQSAVSSSGIFVGSSGHVVPMHSLEALSSNKFYVVGKMFATSIVQGGLAPFCFAKPEADFLVFGTVKSAIDLKDIPDFDIMQSMIKVSLWLLLYTC